jgi:hypothetical protein
MQLPSVNSNSSAAINTTNWQLHALLAPITLHPCRSANAAAHFVIVLHMPAIAEVPNSMFDH